MGEKRIVLGLVGSPNREGRTHQVVKAALDGAAKGGVSTELAQMADHVVAPCKDCLPWVCKDNCGALILGTPVYWSDTSGLVRYLILKMFRVYARSAPLQGLPAFGVAIAGGTGNGLVSGLRPVYHLFQFMQMRAIEPLPVTRFNFDTALEQARKLGEDIAAMANQRYPFSNLEERLLWYDALPYLGLDRASERRLLADLAIQAAQPGESSAHALGLARADALAAAGNASESLIEITRVYEAGAKAFEESEK
jgi:NAD(P)H-dependent FMN reductase